MEERDRRERDQDEKDFEHDSKELELACKRKPSRRVDDAPDLMHQRGEGAENFGMYNMSALFGDKNSLKSKFVIFLKRNACSK